MVHGAADLDAAVGLCRLGHWERGLPVLSRLAEGGARLSSLGYSYLGYGVALKHRKVQEGRRLCQHAVQLEFYQPENLLNLARVELLAGNRRGAHKALQQGLALDRDHAELLALRREMGFRRRPVFRFLSRDNVLNVLIGRVRHAFRRPG